MGSTATSGADLRRGAEHLARLDGAAARTSFRRAAEAARGQQPDEALAWDGVARAESALGEVGRAGEAAQRAWRLAAGGAGGLPRDETERLHARALAAARDWNAAVPALEGLFGRQPERVDVGLDLVNALAAAGRSDAADNALGRLRQLTATPGSSASGDPCIDLAEAEVAIQLSEYQRAAAAATRARRRAGEFSAPAIALRAERLHGEAITRLDRREEARRELESVISRDVAAGLAREAAAARLALGAVLAKVAGNEEATRMLEQALAGLRAAGDRRGQVMAGLLLAIQAGKRGELDDALRAADVVLADARASGDRWAEGVVLSQRLVLLNWADDEAAGKASLAETLTALRESGNRQTLMSTLGNLAVLAIEDLDLEAAEAYVVEAQGLARRVGSQLASSAVERARGYLELTRGDIALSRASYLDALGKARRAGVPMTIGLYLSDLAWVELAGERPQAAAAYATEAIAELTKAGDTRTATATEGVLAWADASRGDLASAHRRLDVLRRAAAADGTEAGEFALLGVEARVAEAEGDWRRAVELRRRTIVMAKGWEATGLMIDQQASLARALHGAGDRAALEELAAELLPELDRRGLRGLARDLRAQVASLGAKR